MKRQQGFAIVEMLLVLVLLGIIAFVAWRVIEANGDVQTAQNSVPGSTVVPSDATNNTAKSVGDLKSLESELNSTQVDDSTTTQLEQQTTF